MDVDDLAASLAEVARVVTPDGRLVACVLHPFAEAGTFEAREPGARFIVEDGYFVESDYRRTFSRRGHEITCSSSRYTLEAYVGKLAAAGFAVEAVREPRPDPAALVRDPSEERWARVPLFLFFSARKVADAHRPPEP